MITLYHCVSARSFRPLWTLEELNLSYELKMLPFPPRVQQKSYLEINPLCTVPTFFDDGMRMTESSAICQYLGTRHGDGILTVRPEEEDFGLFLNWVHFGEATLRTDAEISDAVCWNEQGEMPSVWRNQMHHLLLRLS